MLKQTEPCLDDTGVLGSSLVLSYSVRLRFRPTVDEFDACFVLLLWSSVIIIGGVVAVAMMFPLLSFIVKRILVVVTMMLVHLKK